MRPKAQTKLRILIVDDDKAVSETFKLLLENEGHLVTTAPGGQEALAFFRPDSFDLVITDLAMPGMKGDELAAAIKTMAPAQPVMLITGHHEAAQADENRLKYIDHVLGKPLSYSDLREGILAALAAAHPSAPPAGSSPRDTPRSAKHHVLLVDDSEDDVFLFRNAVSKYRLDWSVHAVSTADSAVAWLSAPGFSIILLDVHLAGGSTGFELISWAKRQPHLANVPIVVLSGTADPRERERCLKLGANCFIEKNADMSALFECIVQYLAPTAPSLCRTA
jgi:CheY-like chemotaxis protein